MIADNFARLLSVQDFYADLERLDEEATLAQLREDFAPDLETLSMATTIIATHEGLALLRTLRSDVRQRLASADLRLLALVEQAAVARAFTDCLTDELLAALTLPWAMHAILLDVGKIEDLWGADEDE